MKKKPNKHKPFKPWKIISKISLKNTDECLKLLKRKGYIPSPWIVNIFKKKKDFL